MIQSNDDVITVAFKACTALAAQNVEAVLCGGSAATFYAPQAYQSTDADFIISWWCDESRAKQVITDLGFYPKGRTLGHPQTPITLDFPKGPLAIGDQLIESWRTVQRDEFTLNVIRPEDSVKDRLCAFFYWKDRSGLEQALYVARATSVDLDEVEAWARSEGEILKYQEFLARLSG